MSAPSDPNARTSSPAGSMNHQAPIRQPKRNGLKTLLGGVGLLALVGVALAATNTLYVWPAVFGTVLAVAGVVMIAMKK